MKIYTLPRVGNSVERYDIDDCVERYDIELNHREAEQSVRQAVSKWRVKGPREGWLLLGLHTYWSLCWAVTLREWPNNTTPVQIDDYCGMPIKVDNQVEWSVRVLLVFDKAIRTPDIQPTRVIGDGFDPTNPRRRKTQRESVNNFIGYKSAQTSLAQLNSELRKDGWENERMYATRETRYGHGHASFIVGDNALEDSVSGPAILTQAFAQCAKANIEEVKKLRARIDKLEADKVKLVQLVVRREVECGVGIAVVKTLEKANEPRGVTCQGDFLDDWEGEDA